MYRTFILILLVLLSLSAPAWASVIYVSGDQTGTWSADTVIVTAEVRVPPSMSLTILPGVEVLFSVYCKLIVDNGATLRAVGTPADSIRFDVLPPNVNWHGIRFLSASDSSRLSYCLLTHGYAQGSGDDNNGGAIYCSNSSLIIIHNTISGNTAYNGGGGIFCYSSSPTIGSNTISGNWAISLGGGIFCQNSSPIITGNTISGNNALHSGGGIYCDYSNPSITGNTISGNYAYSYGGGIYCNNSSLTISDNIISGNSSLGDDAGGGGGICCYGGSPTIGGNTISGNSAHWGGGICCYGSSPNISGNTLSANSASGVYTGGGGGIYCEVSNASISNNTISANSASYQGGGIRCNNSSASISGNQITANLTSYTGGGISCTNSSPSINGNTIAGNSAFYPGGGIFCLNSNPAIVNCILWGNNTRQIYSTPSPAVTYSDIQGGYTGTGNINAWPAFVDTAQGDYRLQWGSPCIDTGDPNPIYNDPDGTRADMGAWYYDQSLAVRILLTPYNAPIQIPPEGGSFQYAIQATNIATSTLLVPLWCDLTLPSGNIYGPVLGPVRISLGSGQTINRVRTQNISAHAPAGMYHYNAYAVAAGDTSSDSFTFTKLGSGIQESGFGGWTNTGESFDLADVGARRASPLQHASGSEATPTMEVAPNPFNPTTVISYQLPVASHVSLRIYDTAGRLVTTLVEGWRDAGDHQITFDGSGLPSGIYFAKLIAGDFSQVQKLMLMK